MLNTIMKGTQLIVMWIIGIYCLSRLAHSKTTKTNIHKDSEEKYEKMQRMRQIKLTEPLTEKMRPKKESDIIGQKEGLKALKAALCVANPQHILIYGSPGIGKTAAARIALEVAKEMNLSPFTKDAKFVEIDATTLRFDERSVADPLIGSVHDPIYQGAGAYGPAGVPQPKMGAVTKANGGILFIDEIGELHPIQMNKLLKVLEDRKVFLESAYYNSSDENIPKDIHDIFRNGLPADFRLIGATTRSREEIPQALRSRCVEIFFRDLETEDLKQIIEQTVTRDRIGIEEGAKEMIVDYAENGRDVITILQTAYNKSKLDAHDKITIQDAEWVVHSGGYAKKLHKKINKGYYIGKVNGLGVLGQTKGMLLEIEAVAEKSPTGKGEVKVTGAVEEEEIHQRQITTKRKSMAQSSVQNVLTLLKLMYKIPIDEYYVHINFPTGIPVDGPSAGIAMFTALYSAITGEEVPQTVAMTGEVTLHGDVYPVGGVAEKVKAAKSAGAKAVIIPQANMQEQLKAIGIEIIPVKRVEEIVEILWDKSITQKAHDILHA